MHCSSYAPPLLLSVSDSARALDRRKNCGDTLSRSSRLLNGESFKTNAYAIHNLASRCVFVAVGCSVGWPECAPVCRCRRFSSSSEMPHASRKCFPSSPCGALPKPAPVMCALHALNAHRAISRSPPCNRCASATCACMAAPMPHDGAHCRTAVDAMLRWRAHCGTVCPDGQRRGSSVFGGWLQVYGPAWRLHEGPAHALQEARPLSVRPLCDAACGGR